MPTVTLRFDEFGWEALSEHALRYDIEIGELIAAACRRYARMTAANPPAFIPTGVGGEHDVTVSLDAATLRSIETRADHADVAVEEMIRDSAFRLLAELDSGAVVVELGAEDA